MTQLCEGISDSGKKAPSRRPPLPFSRPELYESLSAGEDAFVRAFFDGCTTGRLVRTARQGRYALRAPSGVLAPHAVLTRSGDPADQIYRVCSGRLCRARQLADGRRQILCVYLPGDIVGAGGLLWPWRQDTIEALSGAVVQTLEATLAREIMADRPEAALWLLQQVLTEERRLQVLITGLGRADARTRVAWFLFNLSDRLRRRGLWSGQGFTLAMTQQEIGDHLGLTPVYVNRILKDFRETGVVIVHHQIVLITNLARLREFATPLLAEGETLDVRRTKAALPDGKPAGVVDRAGAAAA